MKVMGGEGGVKVMGGRGGVKVMGGGVKWRVLWASYQ